MRTICGALLLSAVAAAGCTHGFGFLDNDTKPPVTQPSTPAAPPEPVTADQITSGNAHRLANQLQDEMERAGRE